MGGEKEREKEEGGREKEEYIGFQKYLLAEAAAGIWNTSQWKEKLHTSEITASLMITSLENLTLNDAFIISKLIIPVFLHDNFPSCP